MAFDLGIPDAKERGALVLFLLLIACYLAFAAMANADLTEGRFALFMDERITFDGVGNILHPGGARRLLWSLADGGDHRYGRILWNSMVPLSFLPERLFGAAGQIFAGRMTQALILVSAFVVFTVTFVKRWPWRLLLMASLLAMPFTDYYMSMPKPEPVQMLFLALFLRFFKKNDMAFGGAYWIFLGLAFGAKISALPLIAVFGGAASLRLLPALRMRTAVPDLLSAVGFFLAGLALAVPILLPAIAAALSLFAAVDWLFARRLPRYGWRCRLALACSVMLLTVGDELFLRSVGKTTGIALWIASTFLSTGHGDDSPAVGLGSWVAYFLRDWMGAPVAVNALLVVAALALAAAFAARLAGGGSAPRPASGGYLALIVMLAGLTLDLAIFTKVHRLWGFYLFPGSVLVLVGLFSMMEVSLAGEGGSRRERVCRALSLFVVFLVAAVSAIWWLPRSVREYRTLAARTSTPQYRLEYASYREVTRFLAQYARTEGRSLSVSYDPALFLPAGTAQYRITERWGPLPDWNGGADVIVIGVRHTPRCTPIPVGAARYAEYRKEREMYDAYVICREGDGGAGKSYRRCLELPNGGEILIRVRPGNNRIFSSPASPVRSFVTRSRRSRC